MQVSDIMSNIIYGDLEISKMVDRPESFQGGVCSQTAGQIVHSIISQQIAAQAKM